MAKFVVAEQVASLGSVWAYSTYREGYSKTYPTEVDAVQVASNLVKANNKTYQVLEIKATVEPKVKEPEINIRRDYGG